MMPDWMKQAYRAYFSNIPLHQIYVFINHKDQLIATYWWTQDVLPTNAKVLQKFLDELR